MCQTWCRKALYQVPCALFSPMETTFIAEGSRGSFLLRDPRSRTMTKRGWFPRCYNFKKCVQCGALIPTSVIVSNGGKRLVSWRRSRRDFQPISSILFITTMYREFSGIKLKFKIHFWSKRRALFHRATSAVGMNSRGLIWRDESVLPRSQSVVNRQVYISPDAGLSI